jgi:hypothetical protein
MRRFASLLAGAVLVGALVAAATVQRAAGAPSAAARDARALEADAATPVRPARLAQVGEAPWHGGPTATSTGATVDVRVSDALPADASSPQQWAEFLASLLHGPELSQLTLYVETLPEVQEVCGSNALGCYAANEMVAPGEAAGDVGSAEIIRHEYGHHIAYHRVNPPWDATDWGPKRWASAENVCARVSRQEASPGDEGSNYMRNPGEAWAETYRLVDELRAGITTETWPIVSASFFPSDPVLQAAAQDVVQPWTSGHSTSATHVFGKRASVWWTRLATPLDGTVRVSASVPGRGAFDVALVGANRRTLVARAQFTGQLQKRAETSVCGQRTLFVRVTSKGAPGRVRFTATTP